MSLTGPKTPLSHILFLFVITLLVQRVALAGVPIVKNGEAKAIIYLPADATPTARYAAKELQEHIRKATGAKLEITSTYVEDGPASVILVGPSAKATALGVTTEGLGLEGFRLKTGDGWLALLGNDDDREPFVALTGDKNVKLNGTLWAVYHFLREHVGVRWYMPGDLGTVIPTLASLEAPEINLASQPALRRRVAQIIRADRRPPNPEDWSPSSKLGQWYLRQGLGRDSRTTFNHTFHFLTGGENQNAFGREYAKKMNYRKTKPQIFAVLPNGERDFDTTSYGMGNLNLSEPDTLSEFVKLIRTRFDENPGLVEFTVAPNDGWQPCMSEGSLAALPAELRERLRKEAKPKFVDGTLRYQLPPELMEEFRRASAENLLRFTAAVASEVYKTHPDRFVGMMIGYNTGYEPPKDIKFPPNITAIYTKTRARYFDPEYKARIAKELGLWSKIIPKMDIWEYSLWFARPWGARPDMDGYPILYSQSLQEDFEMTRGKIAGEYSQNWNIVYAKPGLGHLMQHLMAQMLFDPNQKVADLLEEYYSLFYGAGREPMKKFWTLAEACWMRNTSDLDPRTQAAESIERVFPIKDLAELFRLLEQAKTLVPEGSQEYQRIAMIADEMEVNRGRLLAAPVEVKNAFGPWFFRPDPKDRGANEKWFKAGASGLPKATEVPVPSWLSKTPVGEYLGTGWYVTKLTIADQTRGRRLQLRFNGVDKQAWIYLNGELIGEHSTKSTGLDVTQLYDRPFVVNIPEGSLDPSGVNHLVVRTHASQGQHGIWKPVQLVAIVAGDAPPPLLRSSAIFPAPKIEGGLPTDWPSAEFRLHDTDGSVASPATRVKVAHDPKFLYVAFQCEEDDPKKAASGGMEKGWTWKNGNLTRPRPANNTFEILLQPDAKSNAFASVMVNAGGGSATFFAKHPDFPNPGDWRPGQVVATKVTNAGWSGMVAIPWESLGIKPIPGMSIKANFFRYRPETKRATWSPSPPAWTSKMELERGTERFGTISFPEE